MPDRHPVHAYARRVTSGEIVAGHYVRQAAHRFLEDLQRDDVAFDEAPATRVMSFFREFLRHPDGSRFELLDWQAFAVGQLFGWKTPTGTRRFKHLYLSAGKGSGKSPLVAGIALAVLMLDDEPHQELYCAATTSEQARVQFRDCQRMARSHPALLKVLEVGEHNILRRDTGSFLRPISSEGRALDGKRVSVALIDELQEHPDPIVLDKMTAGTKSRRQPIIAITGNAGYGKDTVAGHVHEYARRILDGDAANDAWLPLIFALDPCAACRAAGHWQPNEECGDCDQWTDEAAWPKANPSLDTVLPREYLREQVREAVDRPSKRAIVMRLNFGIWTSASVRWLPADQWHACGQVPIDLDVLGGQPCVIGVDLGESHDLTAAVALFGDDEQGFTVASHFFIAEDGLDERARRDRADYRAWAAEGLLEVVPGPVVDFEVVRHRLKEWCDRYAVREIAIDRWRGKQLMTRLAEDGLPVVEMPPTMQNIAPAAAALERLLATGKIQHGNHAVLAWNAANCVADTDPLGNVRPSKVRSGGRIDGISALCLALARALAQPPVESPWVAWLDPVAGTVEGL